ncbi:hypothetical protein Tco_1433668, partial [Tanacetum coccineum]
MMTMVMLGRLWCGGDDGSGYDIVGMVVVMVMRMAAGVCGGDDGDDDEDGLMVGCGREVTTVVERGGEDRNAGLKEDMDVRSDVYVLSNGYRKSSDDSHDYYWEYAP